MKKIFTLLFFTALSAPAHAQDSGDLSSCAAIASDSMRLFCYDMLAARETLGGGGDEPAVVTEPAQESGPNWLLETAKSPIDGSDMQFLSVKGVGTMPGQLRIFPTWLMLACREDQTNIWFDFGDEFTFATENGRISYLIDNGPAQNMTFKESDDGHALGLWTGKSAISFANSLFGANFLVVFTTPNSSNQIESKFTISGLEEAVGPLRKACHW